VSEDDPVDAFKRGLLNIKKPIEPPTTADIERRARDDFSYVIEKIEELDAAVKGYFDSSSSITVGVENIIVKERKVIGSFKASKSSVYLLHDEYSVRFTIQSRVILIHNTDFEKYGMTTKAGVRFETSDQKSLVTALSERFLTFFQKGWNV